jgi:hypothetical protein
MQRPFLQFHNIEEWGILTNVLIRRGGLNMAFLSCKNARRDYLNPFGYGTFALPKAGVAPLTLLVKSANRLMPIGPLAATFPPGSIALPASTRNRVAPISGAQSRSVSASIGLDILGSAIGALAGSTLGLKTAYKSASEVEFEFGEVHETRVDSAAIDRYLANTKADELIGPGLRDLLDEDEVYVMTSVLDATQVSVRAKSAVGSELSLSVPVVQQLVGGNLTVSGSSETSSVLTYSSKDSPLAIGAQVLRLFYRDGRYQTFKLVKPTSIAADGREDQDPAAPAELIEI